MNEFHLIIKLCILMERNRNQGIQFQCFQPEKVIFNFVLWKPIASTLFLSVELVIVVATRINPFPRYSL